MNNTPQGIYLVIDPAMGNNTLMYRLEKALKTGIDLLQIWNHWPADFCRDEKTVLCNRIYQLANPYKVPVFINNDWEILNETALTGIHLDELPENLSMLRSEVNRTITVGLTCTNHLEDIKKGEETGIDYFSFCAMFPSSSVDSCEIVQPETVKLARKLTRKPLFLSGGLNPDNILLFRNFDIQGIAVISGIMSVENVKDNILAYRKSLEKIIS